MVKKIFPIIFIVLVWLVFTKPFFLQNKIPYPSDYQVNHFDLWSTYPNFLGVIKNPAMSDTTSQMMPWKKFTIESLKNAELPLWNPYSFSGTPHLANYQSAVFSVSNLFFFFLNFKNAWSLSVLIQPLLAGLFMYLFIRSMKKSIYAGIVSSVSFMFCGFITVWMSWTTLALAITFLPLALYAVEKYSASKQSRFLIILAISFPLSFFSGHFQVSIYFCFYIISFIIFKLFETRNKSDFAYLISFSFFGLLLSAPQIIPSIELYLRSYRSSVFQKINSVQISYFPTILAPDFYGNPVSGNNFLKIYAEKISFVGTIPFLLALYSSFVKSKKIFFFSLMAIISLLLCIDSPITNSVIGLKIPVLSTSSLGRVLVLFSFSTSVLSAFGLDKIIQDIENTKIKHILIWATIILFIFTLLWGIVLGKMINPLFYTVSRNNLILPSVMTAGLFFGVLLAIINKKLIYVLIIIVILLTSFDMLRFATKWQPFESKDLVFPETPIIKELNSLDKTYRTTGPFVAEGSVYFHIPVSDGYDPLYINRYGEFIGTLKNSRISPSERVGLKLPVASPNFSKVIDLLGIKYILIKTQDLNKPWVLPLKKYPKDKFELIYSEKDFQLFQNKDVFPRAFLVEKYEIINNDQKIMNEILNPKFNSRNSAIVEEKINLNQNSNSEGEARIVNYSPNKIDIKTISDSDSLLVLTDNYYLGWIAKIDGKESKIYRTDFTFRGVVIPAGNHNVEFTYKPKSFIYGIYLMMFSIICIILVLVGKWYTKNKWNHQQPTAKSVTKSSAKTANGKQTKKKHWKFKKGN